MLERHAVHRLEPAVGKAAAAAVSEAAQIQARMARRAWWFPGQTARL